MNQKNKLHSIKQDLDTIIIGSGVGGLSAALCLAKAGQKVLIVEQHKLPGGWCQSFKLNGYRFSPGLHYIGGLNEGGSLYKLYKGLGLANDLEFYQMNPNAYEHAVIDGERYDFPNDFEALVESISKHFPKEKEGITEYLQLVQTIGRETQLYSSLNSIWDKMVNLGKLRNLIKYRSSTLKSVIDKFIKDPVLKKVLNTQYGDHGAPPSKASFVLHCGVMDHYFHGGYYPKGGAGAIVKVMLRAIKNHGGDIVTGCGVKRILLEGNNKRTAIGVELENGEQVLAKRVISNADPGKTFLDMVGTENISSKLLSKLNKTNYSISSLILFLAVDMDVQKAGLDTGNIWVTTGKEEDEDRLFDELLAEDFDSENGFSSLFVSCTTLKDPAHFDGKHHTLEVIAFTDYARFKEFEHKRDSAEYLELKEKIINKFIVSLEKIVPGIGEHIVMKDLSTPLSNERYVNSTKGNIYGTEKNPNQVGLNGYKPKTEIENLYLCGASVTAHGISGASYSGVETAAKVLGCNIKDLLVADSDQEIKIIDLESYCWRG
jgi:all-trans-retinol 13,14-reductase